MKYKLTTTLTLLKKHNACADGYRMLLRSLGSKWPKDKPINLLRVLKSNGVDDMMWCFCATVESSTIPRVAIAADCAKSVLKHYTEAYPNDMRVSDCIKACFGFVRGQVTAEELERVAGAAWAAREAAWAAREAAWAAWAAREAAWAAWAAREAAWAAREAAGAAGAAWAAREAAWAAREAAGAAGAAGAARAAREAAWAARAAWAAEKRKQARIIRKWLR